MAGVRARLVLVGDGPLKASLERIARDAGVADKVVFLERVDDVNAYYHAADVFALPSVARSEAFGLVQLEAMASGIPVVNTRLTSGVPYVSPHGVTGLTVPPGDAGALTVAINELLDDPDLRQRYGAAGRRRARNEFSVEEMVRQTLAVYHAAMRVPPGQAVDPSAIGDAGSQVEGDSRVASESRTAPTRADRTS
jgi:rhamnosyl/mannosyltransferase